MERLTHRLPLGEAVLNCHWSEKEKVTTMAVERLAAYEDTGLSPEEVGALKAENAELKKKLEAAVEDITKLLTLCNIEGGCRSCCGCQNDVLLETCGDYCNKSGIGCFIPDNGNLERCTNFKWRGEDGVK